MICVVTLMFGTEPDVSPRPSWSLLWHLCVVCICMYVCMNVKFRNFFVYVMFKKLSWSLYLTSVFVFDLNAERITCGSNSSILLNSETRVFSQNDRHWTCGGKSGIGIAFSLSISVFARQYYFIKPSHWYFPYLSVMLYNLSSLQLRQANYFCLAILPAFC